jgi:hypothetical protein
VAELQALAGGRADLLAEVAGIFEGASEGEMDEPSPARQQDCAARPEPTRRRSRPGLRRGGAGGPKRKSRHRPGECGDRG